MEEQKTPMKTTLNVVLMGEPGVGKTEFVRSLAPPHQYSFSHAYIPTQGIDVHTLIFKASLVKGEDAYKERFGVLPAQTNIITVHVRDVSGSLAASSAIRSLYADVDGALFLFDMNTPSSLDRLSLWETCLQRYQPKRVPLIGVATKGDLNLPDRIQPGDVNSLFPPRYRCGDIVAVSARLSQGTIGAVAKLVQEILGVTITLDNSSNTAPIELMVRPEETNEDNDDIDDIVYVSKNDTELCAITTQMSSLHST